MLKKSRVNKGTFENLPDKILLKNIQVVDKAEKLNTTMSVVIQKAKIADILDKAPASFDGEIWEDKNLVLMPGFFDMHVHFREPGREDEETLESGSFTAANGGFTGVACMPNTDPPIDTQEVVSFIYEETKHFLVDVHPVATARHVKKGIVSIKQ